MKKLTDNQKRVIVSGLCYELQGNKAWFPLYNCLLKDSAIYQLERKNIIQRVEINGSYAGHVIINRESISHLDDMVNECKRLMHIS